MQNCFFKVLKFNSITLFFFSILFFCSCEDILKLDVMGDGNIITDSLRWRNFNINELELSENFILEIYHSEVPALHVETDSNLIGFVKTDFVRNKLAIRRQSDHNIKPSKYVKVRLYIDNLALINVWNRGTIICDTLSSTSLTVNIYEKSSFKSSYTSVENLFVVAEGGAFVDINGEFVYLDYSQSGSGESYLRGNSDNFKVFQDGSGKIEAINLLAKVTNITLLKSGLIYCNVSNYLSVQIKGSGRVYYRNNPELIVSIEGIDGEGQVLEF